MDPESSTGDVSVDEEVISAVPIPALNASYLNSDSAGEDSDNLEKQEVEERAILGDNSRDKESRIEGKVSEAKINAVEEEHLTQKEEASSSSRTLEGISSKPQPNEPISRFLRAASAKGETQDDFNIIGSRKTPEKQFSEPVTLRQRSRSAYFSSSKGATGSSLNFDLEEHKKDTEEKKGALCEPSTVTIPYQEYIGLKERISKTEKPRRVKSRQSIKDGVRTLVAPSVRLYKESGSIVDNVDVDVQENGSENQKIQTDSQELSLSSLSTTIDAIPLYPSDLDEATKIAETRIQDRLKRALSRQELSQERKVSRSTKPYHDVKVFGNSTTGLRESQMGNSVESEGSLQKDILSEGQIHSLSSQMEDTIESRTSVEATDPFQRSSSARSDSGVDYRRDTPQVDYGTKLSSETLSLSVLPDSVSLLTISQSIEYQALLDALKDTDGVVEAFSARFPYLQVLIGKSQELRAMKSEYASLLSPASSKRYEASEAMSRTLKDVTLKLRVITRMLAVHLLREDRATRGVITSSREEKSESAQSPPTPSLQHDVVDSTSESETLSAARTRLDNLSQRRWESIGSPRPLSYTKSYGLQTSESKQFGAFSSSQSLFSSSSPGQAMGGKSSIIASHKTPVFIFGQAIENNKEAKEEELKFSQGSIFPTKAKHGPKKRKTESSPLKVDIIESATAKNDAINEPDSIERSATAVMVNREESSTSMQVPLDFSAASPRNSQGPSHGGGYIPKNLGTELAEGISPEPSRQTKPPRKLRQGAKSPLPYRSASTTNNTPSGSMKEDTTNTEGTTSPRARSPRVPASTHTAASRRPLWSFSNATSPGE